MKHPRMTKITVLSAFLLAPFSLILLFYIGQSSLAKDDHPTSKVEVSETNSSQGETFSFAQFHQKITQGSFAFPYSPLFPLADSLSLELDPAKDSLAYCLTKGYLSVFSDNSLRPEAPVSRLEFYQTLQSLLQNPDGILSALPFSGSAEGFLPQEENADKQNDPIPMGEAVSVLIHFLQQNAPTSLMPAFPLSDYTEQAFLLRFSPFYEEMEIAVSNGLLLADGLSPESLCNRRSLADLIYKAVNPHRRVKNPRKPRETLSVDADDYKSSSIALFNNQSKQFIWQKDANARRSPASLTKIMTVLVAIEHIENLKDRTYVSDNYRRQMRRYGAKLAGFYSYERVSYEDLLYATLLSSGAEAAGTLAVRLAGKESVFIDWMNQKAMELGMYNTQFKTVEGLDKEGQYTTANDMVLLLEYALQNPTFYQIFTSPDYRTSRNRQHPSGLYLESTVLSALEQSETDTFSIVGGKSGTTSDAGLCWATLGIKNESPYILITMGAPLDNISNPTMLQREDTLKIYRRLLPKPSVSTF